MATPVTGTNSSRTSGRISASLPSLFRSLPRANRRLPATSERRLVSTECQTEEQILRNVRAHNARNDVTGDVIEATVAPPSAGRRRRREKRRHRRHQVTRLPYSSQELISAPYFRFTSGRTVPNPPAPAGQRTDLEEASSIIYFQTTWSLRQNLFGALLHPVDFPSIFISSLYSTGECCGAASAAACARSAATAAAATVWRWRHDAFDVSGYPSRYFEFAHASAVLDTAAQQRTLHGDGADDVTGPPQPQQFPASTTRREKVRLICIFPSSTIDSISIWNDQSYLIWRMSHDHS